MDFVNIIPREKSGSKTAGKYDYQKDLAICMLFEYHESGRDYLFIFDYHDDLVIFDAEENPTMYHFFQIKTKDSGNWTLTGIATAKKGKNGGSLNSILGKMYLHKVNFDGKAGSINLVSNAHFSLPLKNSSNGAMYSEICLDQLKEESIKEICDKLKKELSLTDIDEPFYSIAHLKVSSLSTKESSIHTQGIIGTYLHKAKQGKKFNSVLVYQNFFDEVKRRTAYDETISNFDQLKNAKGIGRKKMNEILSVIGENIDCDEIWKRIEGALRHENVLFGDISKICAAWRRLEIDRMHPSNDLLRNLIRSVKHSVRKNNENGAFNGKTLLGSLELVKQDLATIHNAPYDNSYVNAIILFEIYE